MPLIGFQMKFKESIKSGKKKQTIRQPRKRPFKVGDKLYMYTGVRTKKMKKIAEHVVRAVSSIIICKEGYALLGYKKIIFTCDMKDLNRLAIKDGFQTWDDLVEWFDKKYELPFHGVLIEWI